MMQKYIVALGLSLLTSCSVLANVIVPSLVMYLHYNLYVALLVSCMVILEILLFMYMFPYKSRIAIISVVLLMNVVSTVIGALLHIFTDIGLLQFFEKYRDIATAVEARVPMVVLYPLLLVTIYIFINTLIEFPIAYYSFGKIKGRKLLLAVLFANTVSILLGMGGALLYLKSISFIK